MYILLCVFFGLTNEVCNYFKFLCKTYFMVENLKGECLKILNLGKLGLKFVFWKSISSHTHAFDFLYSMLWGFFFKKPGYFFKNSVYIYIYIYIEFRLIQSVFRSIEITFKILCELLSVSINQNWFSINRNSWIKFLKNQIWLVQTNFFKTFQNFFLSLRLGKAQQRFFVVLLQISCKVCLYYPSFCIDFHIFMHYLMVFG